MDKKFEGLEFIWPLGIVVNYLMKIVNKCTEYIVLSFYNQIKLLKS